MPELTLTTNTPQETRELGRRLGEHIDRPLEVDLIGELGAGKTVCVKGIAAGLGIAPDEIRSPTYLVMASHEGRMPLHHIDLYRLDEPGEIDKLGLVPGELEDAVVVIEWAEKLELGLSLPALRVEIGVAGEHNRELTFSAGDELGFLLEGLQQEPR